jgi:hypothetical protein
MVAGGPTVEEVEYPFEPVKNLNVKLFPVPMFEYVSVFEYELNDTLVTFVPTRAVWRPLASVAPFEYVPFGRTIVVPSISNWRFPVLMSC